MVNGKLNKSLLAPAADKLSSQQIKFLLLNFPFTILFNNYKSSLRSLDNLRSQVKFNNGFAYHPNKNVKIRALRGLNTAFSPSILNGLVVFIFFKNYADLVSFIGIKNPNSLTYFSVLIDGHITTTSQLRIVRSKIVNPK